VETSGAWGELRAAEVSIPVGDPDGRMPSRVVEIAHPHPKLA
jgi:hypothetical protein